MPGDEAFKVEGRVKEALPNGTYRVELKNGHCLTAFFAGSAKKKSARLDAGSSVTLQLTPYDLSVGRILVEAKDLK
jgi:translation initiation factor IF-1